MKRTNPVQVHLFRGLPGSGKHYQAHKVCNEKPEVPKYSATIAADDYMVDENGHYRFVPANMDTAHAKCFARYLQNLDGSADLICVCNTNIRAWELAPYVMAFNAWQLRQTIEIREASSLMITTIWCRPEVAWERCSHGVTLDKVLGMYQTMLREHLPLHWPHRAVLV